MIVAERLKNVMAQCARLGRDSVNEEIGYQYISAAKVNDAVNRALIENGLAITSKSKLVDMREVGGKILATVEVTITIYNEESADPEFLEIRGVGSGIDEGDKSVAKAQTMAVKYAWKNSLLIADLSDDPDAVNGKTKLIKTTNTPSTAKSTEAKNSIPSFFKGKSPGDVPF